MAAPRIVRACSDDPCPGEGLPFVVAYFRTTIFVEALKPVEVLIRAQ